MRPLHAHALAPALMAVGLALAIPTVLAPRSASGAADAAGFALALAGLGLWTWTRWRATRRPLAFAPAAPLALMFGFALAQDLAHTVWWWVDAVDLEPLRAFSVWHPPFARVLGMLAAPAAFALVTLQAARGRRAPLALAAAGFAGAVAFAFAYSHRATPWAAPPIALEWYAAPLAAFALGLALVAWQARMRPASVPT